MVYCKAYSCKGSVFWCSIFQTEQSEMIRNSKGPRFILFLFPCFYGKRKSGGCGMGQQNKCSFVMVRNVSFVASNHLSFFGNNSWILLHGLDVLTFRLRMLVCLFQASTNLHLSNYWCSLWDWPLTLFWLAKQIFKMRHKEPSHWTSTLYKLMFIQVCFCNICRSNNPSEKKQGK